MHKYFSMAVGLISVCAKEISTWIKIVLCLYKFVEWKKKFWYNLNLIIVYIYIYMYYNR